MAMQMRGLCITLSETPGQASLFGVEQVKSQSSRQQ